MNFILARRNWAERHWVYSEYYSRIFVAPKNTRNTETKHQPGAVPILLLAILASTTGTYSSLNVSQESNPQPWLLKALVYHSATSAVTHCAWAGGTKSQFEVERKFIRDSHNTASKFNIRVEIL
jgi:hypothetical protein